MNTSKLQTVLTLGVVFSVACGPSQLSNGSEFAVFHYGNLKHVSPAHVVKLDNNQEILAAFKQPSSKASLLQRGIQVTDSQIELLTLMGLLERQENVLVTRIPMLDRQETTRLRDLTARVASSAAEATHDSIQGFKKELERLGQVGSTYPLLFAYVLDGLVWERFGAMGLVRQETGNPFWSGEVWAVSPSRGAPPGTITFWHGRAVMYVVWTEATAPLMTPIMADDRRLRELFADCVDEGRADSQALLELFVPYGLVSKGGECEFPILSERYDDSLHEAGNALARQIADHAVSHLDLEELVREFGFRDESQALVVAYHEMMWDFVDELVRSGTLTRPALLADPPSREQRHVGNLVFVVRKSE